MFWKDRGYNQKWQCWKEEFWKLQLAVCHFIWQHYPWFCIHQNTRSAGERTPVLPGYIITDFVCTSHIEHDTKIQVVQVREDSCLTWLHHRWFYVHQPHRTWHQNTGSVGETMVGHTCPVVSSMAAPSPPSETAAFLSQTSVQNSMSAKQPVQKIFS